VLVVATALVSWRATARVRFLQPPLRHESLWRAFAVPFGNAAFRPLIAAYVIASAGIGINAVTFQHYYQYVLRLDAPQTQVVLGTFLVVFTGSIVAWVHASKRYGKLKPLVFGACLMAVGNTALYVAVPAGGFWIVLLVGAVGLASFVGSIALIDALLTDVLDHDFLRTRQLRSGLFFGTWRFASKMARALSLLVVGLALDVAGFVERSDVQPAGVEVALILLFGPGVGLCFAGAGWILWRYRFDDHAQARVRQLLERRERRTADSVRHR
jgi:GPH family glycoside/pentoside/hexuronide:cation symporter